MAYRKKAAFILKHKPDILVVPECEHPDKLKFDKDIPLPADIVWQGTNKNKGLGIFSYSNSRFRLLDIYQPGIKTILPVAVTAGSTDFILIAIWAYNPEDKNYNYIGQVWKAIHQYEKLLKKKNVILIGDFNSNVFWDKLNRKANHSMVVEMLGKFNIRSVYHEHVNVAQGQEKHPTFYMYRHQNKPYHIDYCFASGDLINKLENIEVGTYSECSAYSDHTPLIVSFKL